MAGREPSSATAEGDLPLRHDPGPNASIPDGRREDGTAIVIVNCEGLVRYHISSLDSESEKVHQHVLHICPSSGIFQGHFLQQNQHCRHHDHFVAPTPRLFRCLKAVDGKWFNAPTI
ncbi:hypothetical protein FQR65_LT18969 [Abscondita terminalis]|nr:hypothetical protein FQR65_LT18969 [Abscondita terminalis]